MFSKEAIEQRKAYLEPAEAVARDLGKLTSASVGCSDTCPKGSMTPGYSTLFNELE